MIDYAASKRPHPTTPVIRLIQDFSAAPPGTA